jgi:hypothetical protein
VFLGYEKFSKLRNRKLNAAKVLNIAKAAVKFAIMTNLTVSEGDQVSRIGTRLQGPEDHQVTPGVMLCCC